MRQAKLPREIQLKVVKEKHVQIPTIMKELKLDCWLIFVRESETNLDPIMNLVVGGDVVWESAFIFANTASGFSKIAIVGNFDAPAEKQKDIWDEVIPYKEGIATVLRETLEKIDPNTIALNYSIDDVVADGLSHGLFLKLTNILSSYKDRFIDASSIIRVVRGRKTPTEVELIKNACELTEKINQKITSLLTTGMAETEIQQLYHEEMDRLGVEEAWQRVSCPAIDADPTKEIGHVGPSPKYFTAKAQTLHNDFGIKLQGYCSDLQRMWFFGSEEEIPNELIHAFNTVREAIRKAANFIKPGRTGYSVDKIARDYIKSQGYEEYGHALGHQVGTKAHDGGVLLGPLWERYGFLTHGLVEEGNVFTLEPHVKTEKHGVVSLEENILIIKDGCQFLVSPQDKFIIIKS